MDLTSLLDECLERLAAGESVAGCLERYPAAAGELAPALAAASQLQALAGYHLAEAQRTRARVALRQALAAQSAGQRRRGWLTLAPWARGLALATALAMLLTFLLATSTVVAGQPGQLAYGLRVWLERAPIALLHPDPADRAGSELAVAERRLADLDAHLRRSGQIEARALEALVAGDNAAAEQALFLVERDRLQVAERLKMHAETMTQLSGQVADLAAAQALRVRARHTLEVANQLRGDRPPLEESPGQNSGGAPVVETPTPPPGSRQDTSSPEPPPTPTLEPASQTPPGPARTPLRTRRPSPSPTAAATDQVHQPTDAPATSPAEPETPTASQMPAARPATATPAGPGPGGPSSTPGGPGSGDPNVTPGGSESTPQGPGRTSTPEPQHTRPPGRRGG